MKNLTIQSSGPYFEQIERARQRYFDMQRKLAERLGAIGVSYTQTHDAYEILCRRDQEDEVRRIFEEVQNEIYS